MNINLLESFLILSQTYPTEMVSSLADYGFRKHSNLEIETKKSCFSQVMLVYGFNNSKAQNHPSDLSSF